jgi:hypothetical protein
MAFWGLGMTYYHPIWEAPNPTALKQGWAALERAKWAGAKTQRERDYIAAIEVFYKDSDKLDHRSRALAYEKAMEQLQEHYADDREAAIFYALALRGNAPPSDRTYASQKKAPAILEKAFAEQPASIESRENTREFSTNQADHCLRLLFFTQPVVNLR